MEELAKVTFTAHPALKAVLITPDHQVFDADTMPQSAHRHCLSNGLSLPVRFTREEVMAPAAPPTAPVVAPPVETPVETPTAPVVEPPVETPAVPVVEASVETPAAPAQADGAAPQPKKK